MPEPVSLLMIEFLTWIASQQRTYAETMEAWRSNCPRHSVWEDACLAGFVQMKGAEKLALAKVSLTTLGRNTLEAAMLKHSSST
jgi:hypothetical protein